MTSEELRAAFVEARSAEHEALEMLAHATQKRTELEGQMEKAGLLADFMKEEQEKAKAPAQAAE